MKRLLPLALLLACADPVRAPDAALDARYQADMQTIADTLAAQGEEAAHALLRQHAEAGNRYAQTRLGEHHLQTAPPDLDEARKWLGKAAAQDHAPAQYQLALLTDGGTADTWLQRAAEQDYAPAQARLAATRGLDGRDADARHWYAQAATQGDADAQYHLGRELWQRGDAEQALHWLERAAAQGHADAQFELGMAYHARGDSARATAWLQQAENRGHSGARKALRR